MNNLEAFKINEQSVYYSQKNAISCAINLIEFGYYQFKKTYKYENLDKLKYVCEEYSFEKLPPFEKVEGFLYNELIDNIKISICFENIMKAILLSNLNIVHCIDRNILKDISDFQKDRPVNIREVLDLKKWENDNRVESTNDTLCKKIKGILKNTINYSVMIKKDKYKEEFNFPSEVYQILNSINEKRNNLHFLNSASMIITSNTYAEFNSLKKFIEEKISDLQSRMFDFLDIKDKKVSLISKSKKIT